jgi:hypothetical protein
MVREAVPLDVHRGNGNFAVSSGVLTAHRLYPPPNLERHRCAESRP